MVKYTPRLEVILIELNLNITSFVMIYCTADVQYRGEVSISLCFCLCACVTSVAPWIIPHVGHTKDRWARRHCATLHQHVLYYHVCLHCVLTY